MPSQVPQPAAQPLPATHLGRGPPGPWPGSSCAGPQQTGSRTERAPGRPAEARGPLAAHRSGSWAAASARPGSSAWLLGKCTGPLQGPLGVSAGDPPPPHPDLWRHRTLQRGQRRELPAHPLSTPEPGSLALSSINWLAWEQRSQEADPSS